MMDAKELIARRIAKDFKDGDVVNLGIGLPTMVPNYIPKGVDVIIHSENGIIGMGFRPEKGKENYEILDSGTSPSSVINGGSFIDSSTSFGLVRGKHIDATVLGTFEVDQEGNIANYMVPGKMVSGMGGAMDLVSGAKKVYIATTHTAGGQSKILKKCTLPLTGAKKASVIVTELAYIEVTPEGLVLKETAPGVSLDEVVKNTEADLIISPDLKEMEL
jgi:acetate CoA/acetoacetate CoA-transferase beta subunit